jgi:plasmid stability protein
MADILVRDLSDDTVILLKSRAQRNGRSLQAELKEVLEHLARTETRTGIRLADEIRSKLAGRPHSDSAELIAEDRAR